MNFKFKALIAAASLITAGVGATQASAFTPWQYNHPGRVEVNHRLAMQNFRIQEARRDGRITAFQAYRLHQEDRNIRMQERWFASRNGSHLTRGEHRFLNREENGVSHRI
ncbi:MAG TPA: hypothetical protein VKQ70_03250 [Caulobacteraceae bacterium]|jgi:hypothetical protein|nr:hypothetical protein [Caulobacteraceae bacterium]